MVLKMVGRLCVCGRGVVETGVVNKNLSSKNKRATTFTKFS